MEKEYIISYKWALNEDQLFFSEIHDITVGAGYTFDDFLWDNRVDFENDDNVYYVLGDDGKRTGEIYLILDTVEKDIFLYPDATILQFIEEAPAWDSEKVIEAVEYLCNRYGVDMYDGEEPRYNDDILNDLKKAIN